MFLALVTYTKPIEEIDKLLLEHRAFLAEHYKSGTLICSGPQNPRTGGVILGRAHSKAAFEKILADDPFKKHDVATYQIIEFEPVKYADGFEKWL